MSDTEELNVGDFDPSTYQHVLPEGAHDFDDYDSDYEEQHPGWDSRMNRSRQRWQSWILKTRNSTRSIVNFWTPTIASMAKSLRCQT